jgi:hypothetical protein
MSVTSRTPSATVNPSSDRLDLFARWTDLNNLTVFDVLWFVISPQLCVGIVDAINIDGYLIPESPTRRLVYEGKWGVFRRYLLDEAKQLTGV